MKHLEINSIYVINYNDQDMFQRQENSSNRRLETLERKLLREHEPPKSQPGERGVAASCRGSPPQGRSHRIVTESHLVTPFPPRNGSPHSSVTLIFVSPNFEQSHPFFISRSCYFCVFVWIACNVLLGLRCNSLDARKGLWEFLMCKIC